MIPNPFPCTVCGYPPAGFVAPGHGEAPPAPPLATQCAFCGGAVDPAKLGAPPGAQRGAGASFALGFGAFLRGVWFLLRRSRTKRYAIFPLAITAVLMAASFFAMWHFTGDVRASLSSAEWMPEWVRATTRVALGVVLVLLFLVFAWAASAPIASALSAPFLDPLVGRVDEEVQGRRPGVSVPFVRDTAFSIAQSLAILPFLLAISLTAVVLAFVPFAGPVIGFAFLSFGVGLSGLDIAGSRRRWTLRQKLSVAATNLPALLGFGAAGALLGLVPVLPLLIGIPASAIGATLLLYSLDLRGSALVRPPPVTPR